MSAMSPDADGSPLRVLNGDVLDQIREELRALGWLRQFSLTCHWIRATCMPTLFTTCAITVRSSQDRAFLPEILWPYVRSLSLVHHCSHTQCAIEDVLRLTGHQSSHDTHDPLLCGLFDGSFLRNSISQLPQLTSVSLKTYGCAEHGLPWLTLQEILSIPRLRSLSLDFLLFRPKGRLSDILRVDSLPPLTYLHYRLHDYRPFQRAFPSEREALAAVLGKLHKSLEVLSLPSEPTPLREIAYLDWPRLRELELRGEHQIISDVPLIALLKRMPNLRVLSLRLALPVEVDSIALWPPHYGAPDEQIWFPELERITISHPHLHDEIYTHIPRSLRSLSLRCWPHYSKQQWQRGSYTDLYRAWSSPLLTSSEMLDILTRCHVPYLTHLELEYRADDQDNELLRYISTTFRGLTLFELHRHRVIGDHLVPMETIAQELGELAQLREVRLHLDLPHTPRRTQGPRNGVHTFDASHLEEFLLSLREVANVFARALSPTVESIWLLHPTDFGPEWVSFRIIRENATDTGGVHAVFDHEATRQFNHRPL